MEPILEIAALKKYYGKEPNLTRALDGISFQVMPGEFLGIMGSSGSGKSTLLNCIATVIAPSSGAVALHDKCITTLHGKALADYRSKEIGYLFQNFELIDNLTGRENILLPLALHGVSEGESRERLTKLADYLEVTDVLDKFPAQMSGGQKQRIAAARALILDPEIVLPLIKHVLRTRKVRGFDICEISPRFDQDNTTANLGAVIIFAVINTLCRMNGLEYAAE